MTAARHAIGTGPGVAVDRLTRGHRFAERSHVIQVAIGVVVALVFLAVTAASNDRLVMMVALVAVATSVVSPVAGLATIAVILPMREPEALKPLYIDAALVLGTGLGCLLRSPASRRPLRVHPAVLLLIGYVLYTLISTLPIVSGYPTDWMGTAVLQGIRILTAAGLFIVASYLFRDVRPGPVIAAALFGAWLAAALALLSFLRIGPLDALEGLLAPLPTVAAGLGPAAVERAVGGFSNANYMGFFAVQGSLLAIGCWPLVTRRHRPVLAVVIATLVAAAAVSFSRSAYIGLGVGLVVLAFLRSRRAAVVLVLVAGAAAVTLYPVFLDARIEGSGPVTAQQLAAIAQGEYGRAMAAAAGIELFLREPVFGTGYGVFHALSPAFIGASQATYSHNAYIQILAEQGVVGVAMVAGIVLTLIVSLVRSTSALRGAALAMLAAYLVQSLFINSTQSIQISGTTWLVMAAALSAADGRRASPAREG